MTDWPVTSVRGSQDAVYPMPASQTSPSSGFRWGNSFSMAANDANVHTWFFCSVIGLPGEEDWPRDVALPRQAFHAKAPQPIEKFVTDIDEQGKDLLLVSSPESVWVVLMRDVTCPPVVPGEVDAAFGITYHSHAEQEATTSLQLSFPHLRELVASDCGIPSLPAERERV